MLTESNLPTRYGEFTVRVYDSGYEDFPHLVFFTKNYDSKNVVDVRVHSECMTGDVFGSARCDCGEQLDFAMRWIQEHEGVLIYLRQEGRGIGLVNKLKAYNLQDQGFNTCDANTELGFEEDSRTYEMAVKMLEELNISAIRLLTNNPEKLKELGDSGIKVVDRIPVEIAPNSTNESYLRVKKDLMGHFLRFD